MEERTQGGGGFIRPSVCGPKLGQIEGVAKLDLRSSPGAARGRSDAAAARVWERRKEADDGRGLPVGDWRKGVQEESWAGWRIGRRKLGPAQEKERSKPKRNGGLLRAKRKK